MDEKKAILITGPDDWRIVDRETVAEPGQLLVSGREHLYRVLEVRQMDEMRANVLGLPVPESKNKQEASYKLWLALESTAVARDAVSKLDAEDVLSSQEPEPYEGRDLYNPNKKKATRNPPEEAWVVNYEPGRDNGNIMSGVFFKKLPPQARVIFDHMRRIKVWIDRDFVRWIHAWERELNTTQSPDRVYFFYRLQMVQYKLIRPVSFMELATSDEFEGMTLMLNEWQP